MHAVQDSNVVGPAIKEGAPICRPSVSSIEQRQPFNRPGTLLQPVPPARKDLLSHADDQNLVVEERAGHCKTEDSVEAGNLAWCRNGNL